MLFRSAELVNKSKLVEECIKKVTVAKVSRQGFPPRRLSNHQAAGRRVHFKARGIRQHKNLQVGNITARRTGKNGGKVRQGNGKRARQGYINPACKQYGKEHSNRSCQFGSPNCYACGELGHVAKDCPKGFTQNSVRTQQQGRVFAITIDDVVQSNALIQGQVMSRIDF